MASIIHKVVAGGALAGATLFGAILGTAQTASATPVHPSVNACDLPTAPNNDANLKQSFSDCNDCQVQATNDIRDWNFSLRFYCVYNNSTGLSDEYWNLPTGPGGLAA